jgi:hypothetical protein
MTKKEILEHVRDNVEFTDHMKNYREDLTNANKLMCEGALVHQVHSCECPFQITNPSFDFCVRFFSLVDGFDYTEYEF